MWFTYILRCSDNSLYTGITTDPKKRFLDHTGGKGGAYTRSHRPIQIVYLKRCASKSAALKQEAYIKGLSKKQKESLLPHHNPVTGSRY